MVNALGNYNETFFAQEALIQLEEVMGLANRVHRDFDSVTRAKGNVIQIRRPSTFTATDAPATATDLTPDSVSITLDQWKEVKFLLTDKDLSLSNERIISDHIRPAAVALANQIDQTLAALYIKIPWRSAMTATPVLADLSKIHKIMFDNKVPMNDGLLNFMIDGATNVAFLDALAAAGQHAGTQDPALRRASLGRLFDFDVWANQNTPTHTGGVAADFTGAIDEGSDYAAGVTTVHVDQITSGATILEGDTFLITGDTQAYVLTKDGYNETTGDIDIDFDPPLKQAVLNNAVVTFTLAGTDRTQNMAFHRNAFALAMAPLSTMGGELGAKIATATDPKTSLSLRSRMYYVGNSSEVHIALDVLYGVGVLDVNLAVRGTQPT